MSISSSLDTQSHGQPNNTARVTEELVLVVSSGARRGERVRLGQQLTVGQAQDNELVLPDDTVSGHHCVLERTSHGVVLKDLGSLCQTRIGHITVREVIVEPGAVISVGGVELQLRSESPRALGNSSVLNGFEDREVDSANAGNTAGWFGALPVIASFAPGKSYREVRSNFEAEFERRYVTWLLDRHQGNISAASREARMDRKHLFELARKHGLRGEKS